MGAATLCRVELLGEVIGDVATWVSNQVVAPIVAAVSPEAAPYVCDEATADGASQVYGHYVDENGIDQEGPPPVPEERPELEKEELDGKVREVNDALARPDPTDVSNAVTTLVGLSDAQRKEALGQLSDEEFDALMENLPPGEHERLGELVGSMENPRWKLRAWKASETAEAGRDVRNLDAQPHGTETPMENDYFLDRQRAAAKDTETELDDEFAVAKAELDAGTMTPEEEKKYVDDLIARKDTERSLEREHGVNITNDRTEDHRRVWSKEELDDLGEVLHELPPDAARDNRYLDEIHRAERNERGDVGGYSNPRLIIYDNAMSDTQDHHGDKSELTGHDGSNVLKAVQQTMAHELGHSVEDSPGEMAFTRKVWRPETGGDAADKLAATDANGVAPDGRVYKQVGDEIVSYDPGTMPTGGAHDGGVGGDTWDYAHMRPNEYFAESYSKATMVPELYYQDLIAGPQAKIAELEKNGAPADEIARAKANAANMAEQHQIMRTQVLGLDESEIETGAEDIASDAEARGLSDDDRDKLVEEYRAKAAMAMTPQQLERLRNKYLPPPCP